MSEIERLKNRLFHNPDGLNAKNFSVSPGPLATPETIAREVNKALDALAAGDYEEITEAELDD